MFPRFSPLNSNGSIYITITLPYSRYCQEEWLKNLRVRNSETVSPEAPGLPLHLLASSSPLLSQPQHRNHQEAPGQARSHNLNPPPFFTFLTRCKDATDHILSFLDPGTYGVSSWG